MNIIKQFRHQVGQIILALNVRFLRAAGIEIGEDVFISPFAQIDMRRGSVSIGDDVSVTAGCRILSHSAVEERVGGDGGAKSEVIIEDNAWIGVDSIVLPGVRIGENSIVGAGSVVTRDVGPNTLVAGNPAEKIRDL